MIPTRKIIEKAEELLLKPGNTPEIWRDAWVEYFRKRNGLTAGREASEMGMLIELICLEFELPMARDHHGNGAEHIRKLLRDNLINIQETHIMRPSIRGRLICVRDLEDKDLSAKSGRSMTVPRAFVNTVAMEIFFDVIADNRMNTDDPKVKAAFREIYGVMKALTNVKVPLGTDMQSCMTGFEHAFAHHEWSDAELDDLFFISDSIDERDYLGRALAICLPPARLAKLASDGLLPLSVVLRLVPEIVRRDGDSEVTRDFITAVQKIPGIWEANGQAITEKTKKAFEECWEESRRQSHEYVRDVAADPEGDIREAMSVLLMCCRGVDSIKSMKEFKFQIARLIHLQPYQLAKWAIVDTEQASLTLILEAIEKEVLDAGGTFTWNPLKWNLKTGGRQFSFFSSKPFGRELKEMAIELDKRKKLLDEAHVPIPRDHARSISIAEMCKVGEIMKGLLCLMRMVKKERENPPDPGNENLLAVEEILRKNRVL